MTATETDPAARVRELLRDNYPLVMWLARRAVRKTPWLEAEDLAGEIAVLALRTAGRYDPGRAKLSTWLALVTRAVVSHSLSYHFAECRTPGRAAGDATRHAGAGGDPADAAAEAEVAGRIDARLARAVARLPERERRYVRLKYGLDGRGERTLAEVDPACSRERVRQVIARGLSELREELGREEG